MIEPDNPDLSICKQCKLLSISRSSFYYTSKGEAARVPLLRGNHGLAHPQGFVLADLEQAGGRLLPLSADCFAIACRVMVEALNEAIHKFGPPEIMNTDQGSQFTSFAWTDRLRRSGVCISMDGKGRFLDNIFAEWLLRSLKCECVYLHA